MPRTDWTIRTETDEIVASATLAEWPNLTINRETFITVWLEPTTGSLTVANGETHTVPSGTIEFWDDVTVEDGGELVVEDGGELIVGTIEERWEQLGAYTDYAGQAVTGESLNNVPWFREQLPSDARVSSIVLGFDPNEALKDRGVDGFWGVLLRWEDRRNSVLSTHRLELECMLLDRIGEYGSVNELKLDLEA